VILVLIFQILIFPFIKAFLRLRLYNFVNVLELHQSRDDKWYNKRVLIWRFTLVLIKINYGQIGDQTALYTTNPVFYTSANRFVRQTDTFGNLIFFHLSRRTTVIQDLLCQFSLVPDNGTNFNVEACSCIIGDKLSDDEKKMKFVYYWIIIFFLNISALCWQRSNIPGLFSWPQVCIRYTTVSRHYWIDNYR
jgi:drug/metabolite transporter (DMT)-like permease